MFVCFVLIIYVCVLVLYACVCVCVFLGVFWRIELLYCIQCRERGVLAWYCVQVGFMTSSEDFKALPLTRLLAVRERHARDTLSWMPDDTDTGNAVLFYRAVYSIL